MSRATIVNYLKESKERGIGHPRKRSIASKLFAVRELSARYRLADVYVAHVGPEAEANFSLRQTARVAAMAWRRSITRGFHRCGRGETVKQVADNPHSAALRKQSLSGHWIHGKRQALSAEAAIQIANRIEARCHTLHRRFYPQSNWLSHYAMNPQSRPSLKGSGLSMSF